MIPRARLDGAHGTVVDHDARGLGLRQHDCAERLGGARVADRHLPGIEVHVLPDPQRGLDVHGPAGDLEAARAHPVERLAGVVGERADAVCGEPDEVDHEPALAQVADHARGPRRGLRGDLVARAPSPCSRAGRARRRLPSPGRQSRSRRRRPTGSRVRHCPRLADRREELVARAGRPRRRVVDRREPGRLVERPAGVENRNAPSVSGPHSASSAQVRTARPPPFRRCAGGVIIDQMPIRGPCVAHTTLIASWPS